MKKKSVFSTIVRFLRSGGGEFVRNFETVLLFERVTFFRVRMDLDIYLDVFFDCE